MKVGTDGVLLGAWVLLRGDERSALDVGTGTGLIALMLAQRTDSVQILGIDIDPAAAGEAAANFAASPWTNRLAALPISLQSFISESEAPASRTFDLIASNPPFFSASLKAPEARRRAARHDDTLPLTELIAAARRLLAPNGRVAVIYPPEEAAGFRLEAESAGLYLSRLTKVISVAGQPPKRHLMEFSRTAALPTFDDLVIGSPEYLSLTGAFYL